MPEVSLFFETLFRIIEPFLAMMLVAFGWMIVAELRRHGYRATYAAAIVRAMGAGVLAAQEKKLDPFSPEGRLVVAVEGARYITRTVPEAADALEIDAGGHAARVTAQLGATVAQAEALATVASEGNGVLKG